MKQCFGYVRVSTVKQGDGVSLEAQREAIEAFAVRNDIKITEWFEETVTAAKKGRPLFNQMVASLKRRKASGVVFHKIDRSARNFADWARIGDLAEIGISIHFASESLDFNSRGGRLAADVQAVFAADYVRNLREESIKGQKGRLKQGLYPYSAPVGYLNTGQGNPKAVDPYKAPLIKTLFELYATGNHSHETLAVEMKKRGLRNVRGGPISITGISHILINPFYMGVIKIKQSGDTYPGIHKPIISAGLFNQAEEVRTGRRRKVKTIHNYLFRGLFQCGYCGRAMVGERPRTKVYYRCQRKDCPTKTIQEAEVERVITHHLKVVTFAEEQIEMLRQKFMIWLDGSGGEQQERKAAFELHRLAERKKRLSEKFVDDLIDEETYKDIKSTILLEEKRWQELSAFSDQKEEQKLKLEKALDDAKNLYNKYFSAALEQKREIIKFACSTRLVFGKNIKIEPPNWYLSFNKALEEPLCPLSTDRTLLLLEIEKFIAGNLDMRS